MFTTVFVILAVSFLLLEEVHSLEGLVKRNATVKERERMCEPMLRNLPTSDDVNRQCQQSNKNNSSEKPFLFGPSECSKQLSLELNCDRLNCFTLYLFFDPTGKFLDCNDISHLDRVKSFIMTCNSSKSADDLKPGQYCVRYVEYGALSPGELCYRGTKYSEMHSLPPAIINPEDRAAVYQNTDYTNNLAYLSIIPLAAIMLGALFVFYTKCREKKPTHVLVQYPPSLKYTISQALQETKPVNVFILYSRECPHHQHVVDSLAKFLVANNCKVAYNVWEINEIATNKVGWIDEKLSGKYKIILVVSKKCFEKQHALLTNEKKSIENGTLEESLFVQAIATIMHRTGLAFDYSNLFMVRPEYVSPEYVLRDISPGRVYLLPRYIGLLVCHLHELDTELLNPQHDSWAHCPAIYNELYKSIDVILKQYKVCEHCSKNSKEYV